MKDIELLQSYGKPLQHNEMQLAYVLPWVESVVFVYRQ